MAAVNVVLAGHEGSKRILSASSYLIWSALPKGFSVKFLNFGEFTGKLFTGEFVSLDREQEGGAWAWSRYISRYLNSIPGDFVIFGLDDYLLSGTLDQDVYEKIYRAMVKDPEIVCGRLCQSDFYRPDQIFTRKDGLLELKGEPEYSCTTQWAIWRRSALIEVLAEVKDPWSFEIAGSVYMNASGLRVIGSKTPALVYPDESCLSSKWSGVRVRGNPPGDVEQLVAGGYLKREELC